MKPFVVPISLVKTAILFVTIFTSTAETGQNSSGLKIATPKPPKSVRISHEAGEVLKLVRADVADDVVMAFIKSSKTGFDLTADEIIALHNEGVADEMINEMLARKKQAPRIIVAAAQPAQPAAPQQTVVQQAAPTVTYVQQPQTVYVPAPATTYVYRAPVYTYAPYPYYYRSHWSYPRVSFNFGFGHHWGHHHWGHHRFGHFGHHRGFHGHFRR